MIFSKPKSSKILAITVFSLSCTSAAYASSNTTTGGVSDKFSLTSTMMNPAASGIMLDKDENIRIGYFSNLSATAELGDVNEFETEINDLLDILEEENVTLDDAQDSLDRFNAILPVIGDQGYFKISQKNAIPLFPMVFKTKFAPGIFALDVSMGVDARGSVLDDILEIDAQSETYQTNSSLYLKSAQKVQASLGYSHPIWKSSEGKFVGQLLWGSRLNAYRFELSKQVIGFETFEDEDVEDVVSDDYDKNQVSASGVGLDQGLLWVNDHYQLGMTFKNLNEPEFEFASLDQNCLAITDPQSQNNCFLAQYHANTLGNIELEEKHTMHAYATFDGSFFITQRWGLSLVHDLGEYEDVLGDDIQLTVVSTHYQPRSLFIPGLRAGYKKNNAGTELESVAFGINLFGIANLDLEYGLDKTKIDGDEIPRVMALSLGFEERF
ncbi:MAG: conjugal transfer protein TraF [Pseudomonadota bacterium]